MKFKVAGKGYQDPRQWTFEQLKGSGASKVPAIF
jgi:hypothetical protein